MKRPNILFAVADDASHFGVYGHKFVKTPNIDRLAQDGIIFNNAFTVNPKCAPSRACILTGRHTWQLEEACNHFGIFSSKFPVYPDILEENGYWTGFTGKGWAPGDYKAGGFKRNPAGNEYNNKRLEKPQDTMISDCDYYENFVDFLSKKPEDQPFCFWFGCYEPHRHYMPGEGARTGKNTCDIESLPSYLPDCETVRQDFLDYANEIDWFDLQFGKMLDKLKALGEYENTLIIVTSDNGCPFPRIKGQMYEHGFHLPMVASWKAASEGGRHIDDIISFIDLAPTFLEAAGIEPKFDMAGKSFLDIFFSDNFGIINKERNRAYFGREKHDMGRKGDVGYPVRCVRSAEYLYIHNLEPDRWPAGDPETWFTNCDGGPTKIEVLSRFAEGKVKYFQLCFGRRDAEELYNIIDDPECLHNLAESEPHSAIKKELSEDLERELIRTNDPRIKDKDFFEKFSYVCSDSSSFKAYKEGRFELQGW